MKTDQLDTFNKNCKCMYFKQLWRHVVGGVAKTASYLKQTKPKDLREIYIENKNRSIRYFQ